MENYLELTKAMQSAMPKIDYAGLTETFAVLSHASSKLCSNWEESIESMKSQLEAVSNKWQAQIKGMQAFDFSVVKSFQQQIGSFQKMEGSIYDAVSKIDTESITKVLKVSNPFANYDYDMMAKALQNSFRTAKEKQENIKQKEPKIILESIVAEVKEEYNKGEAIIDKDSSSIEVVKEKKKLTTEDVWKIIERIGIIITIIVGLKGLFVDTATKIYNSVYETNNYYINVLNIDADYWNMFQYRIVNRNNVMPRIKPDCTSRVMGHLSEGCVVQVLDKRGKWVQICWKDEEGSECCGWIQNYKLDEFKNNQLKRK